MRSAVWAGILAAALAGPAAGDDAAKPAGDAVRTESLEEFVAELRAFDQADSTTLQRVAKRRRLAELRLIHREGRILDVKPATRAGRETVCVEVRGLRDADETVPLTPEECDAAAVVDWNRGDGVAWLERPAVGPDGEIRFEPVVAKLTDLLHVPDPDAAPASAEDEKPAAPKPQVGDGGASFATWLRLFADACRAGEWRRAWLVYGLGDFAGRAWVLPGRVAAIEAGGVSVAFDEPSPAWPGWRTEAARRGIGRADGAGPVVRHVDVTGKPAELPAVGTAVLVALDVDEFATLEALKAADGVLRTGAALRREEPAASAAQPVPKSLTKPMGKPAEYAIWIEKFAAASHGGDASAAAGLWADAAKKSWVFPAVVKSVADGRFAGRFCRDAFFKGTLRRKEVDSSSGNGWANTYERPAGLWGFDPKVNQEFAVPDPDLAAALRVNSFVDVVIDLDPQGAAVAMTGPFPAALTVWRFSGTAARPQPAPK